MWRLSLRLLVAPALLTLLLPTCCSAGQFVVYPVKMSLPVYRIVHAAGGDQVAKKTLKEKDIVNLALGRPLGTKVDKQREVLAASVARFSTDTRDDTLIVFDPSQNGLAQVTATIAEISALDYQKALFADHSEGAATVHLDVHATTLGNPAANGLGVATIWGAASGKGQHAKASITGVVAGRLSLTLTERGQPTAFSGFIVNGKAKVSAKILGMYTDGSVFVGCGDGIIEPDLGEECERLADESACPGHCDFCRCNVCGNDRVDPGEICDGTDRTICDQLGPFTSCFADCSGCAQCGDSIVTPPEECDYANGGVPQCPGRCLAPECQCGCDPNDRASCPADQCCSAGRCYAPKSGFPSDDPSSPFTASGCSGGSLPSGLCGGLLAPGSQCPDQDPGNTSLFLCFTCSGKFMHKTCTLGAQSCVLDETGPLP